MRGSGAESDCEPECEPERTGTGDKSDCIARVIRASADADPKELLKRGRVIVELLMRELELVSSNIELIERIVLDETEGDKNPKRRQMILRLISLPTRSQAARNLISALTAAAEAGPGKKKLAQEEAEKVGGAGSQWGSDLDTGSAFPN